MKKLSLLILLVLVASMLVAAIPTKMVRLTVINKSGGDVYIKLEGSEVTQAFYYLTIPAGDKNNPTIRVFTIMVDYYTRTTWACGGVRSSGYFFVSQNIRLNFIPCNVQWSCRRVVGTPFFWGCDNVPGTQWHVKISQIYTGEPTLEKVTYLKFLYARPFNLFLVNRWFHPDWPRELRWAQYGSWAAAYLYGGYWNYGCGLWFWRIRSWYVPVGCAWRYRY